jgi:hypothetical protein
MMESGIFRGILHLIQAAPLPRARTVPVAVHGGVYLLPTADEIVWIAEGFTDRHEPPEDDQENFEHGGEG